MTYRRMAEVATDLACKKLGVGKPCETAEIPLPGSEPNAKDEERKAHIIELSTEMKATEGRHGSWSGKIRASDESEVHLSANANRSAWQKRNMPSTSFT